MDKAIKCFACDKELRGIKHSVLVWDEDTTVDVGPECYRQIKAADKRGEAYRPPKGGARLGLRYGRAGLTPPPPLRYAAGA